MTTEQKTDTEKPLSKHLSAAVNAIQKEIDKKHNQVLKLHDKANAAEQEAEILSDEISGLQEQIAKLRGE